MQIQTERLLLRDFIEADWEAMLAYQSDPRYLRFYPADERTEAQVRQFLQMFLNQQSEVPRYRFQMAVVQLSSGRLIGNCGVRKQSSEALQAEIGYELAPQAWGQGFATEAARTMLAFGFTYLGVHRFWAQCVADNTASRRVLEKIGMRQEGHLSENEYFKGRWWDTLLYGILKQEWESQPADWRKLDLKA